MKQISMLLLFALLLNCKEEKTTVIKEVEKTTTTSKPTKKQEIKTPKKTNVEKQTIVPFLKDIKNLEKDTKGNPIENFKNTANAKEVIILSKDNIKTALERAKKFNNAVIVVENHTIVKIINLQDCKPSGAWSTCMPKGEGYIKKGALIPQKDYINNIIGRPDKQERKLFLF